MIVTIQGIGSVHVSALGAILAILILWLLVSRKRR